MGNQTSVPERAKPADLEKYGTFTLRKSQLFSLNVLSDVVTMLVKDNNLFDLAEMLRSEMGCQSLITVIKSKLEREFTTLQFPDYSQTGKFTPVGFISDQKYKALAQNDKDRSLYCAQFAFFIVRFTLLISALTASVAFQENMYKDFRYSVPVTASTVGINDRFKNLKDTSVTGERISGDIVSAFKATGMFKNIPNDTRPLYYFGSQDSVVVDIDKGIVYNPQSVKDTAVLRISFNPVGVAPAAPAQYIPAPVAPEPVAPVAPVAPAPAQPVYKAHSNAASTNSANYRLNPLARGSNIFSTSSGSTASRRSSRRRSRAAKRNTRKRRTVGGGVIYRVVLSQVTCPETGPCEVDTFDMDDAGNTYATGTTVNATSFANRVGQVLNRQTNRFLLENPAVLALQTKSKFSTFAKLDGSAYSVLSYYQDAIVGTSKDKENVTSPAIYRAFLISSGTVEDRVDTMICTDAWRGVMTSAIPYALLQSLYYDENGGTKSAVATDELREVAAGFLKSDIARPYVQNSAVTPTEFSQLAFIEPKTVVPAFCGNITSGVRSTNIPAQKDILTKAHQDLRNLYDVHLENVVKFIRKVMSLKEGGWQKRHIIRLNPIFVTSEKGAQAALDGFIAEGRKLISDHYLAVETIYKKAILDISNLGKGVAPA